MVQRSSGQNRRKTASRSALTVRSLLIVGYIGVALTIWNSYIVRRDIATAVGPESPDQERFFVGDADRPDIATFFRKLSPAQRLAMSRNIGRYRDPELAKLCGILLGDFDPAARRALSESLALLAKVRPDAVASQLSEQGSFQYLGVSRALRAAGESAIPTVARELYDPAARSNAEEFLVEVGDSSIGAVFSMLSASDPDVRFAAEATLGKLRAKSAVPSLLRLYRGAKPDEKGSTLTALAEIADPTTADLMASVLADRSEPISMRTDAALGLGRLGTTQAATVLWRFVLDHDSTIQEQVMNALQICGTPSLEVARVPKSPLLAVAAHVAGDVANAIIRRDLRDQDLIVSAEQASDGRPALAGDVAKLLADPVDSANGEIAQAGIDCLASTEAGSRLLPRFTRNPNLAGFIVRHRQLQARSDTD